MDYAGALVEHPRWRWEPGMRYARKTYHYRAPANCEGVWIWPRRTATPMTFPCVPCLDDPATKGWLLHMLREATGTQDACATWLGGEWRLYGWIGASALGRFATEGEALAAALLAAWGHVA